MFFVHPQIRLRNFSRIITAFFGRTNLQALEQKLSHYFPGKQLIFTDMGRTAFRIIIEKMGLQNSQILAPAYICDIFLRIFKRYNIQPIFMDIDLKTFNIIPEEIERKITQQTKAILISHTYGLPNNMEKIMDFAKKYDLAVIEDCAHSFTAKINRDPTSVVDRGRVSVGNFGDVSFFSLYKQFPALRGGLLVCPKDWKIELQKTKFNFRDFISLLNCFSFLAFLFKKFSKPVAKRMLRKEKSTGLARINKVSLNLFSSFFNDFEKAQEKRKKLALFFQKELAKLGFQVQEPENNAFCYVSALTGTLTGSYPVKFGKRDELVERLRKQKIFCTRIWRTPIILNPEAQKEYSIDWDNFPNTVEAAQRIINFPLQNYYVEKDIKDIISSIKNIISSL